MMRNGLIAIGLIAVSIGLGPQAAAQNMENGVYDKPTGAASPPTGNFYGHSRLKTAYVQAHDNQPSEAYLAALDFTTCVQRAAPDRLAKFLAQSPGSRAERYAAHKMMKYAPGCHSQAMATSLSLLRSAGEETVAAASAS